MQGGGDFKTTHDVKSKNGALAEYWAYINGWIALAAQKMGVFDIAYPTYQYLASFYHQKNGDFTTQYPYGESDNIVDAFTTAQLGLITFYFGKIEKAKRAGKLLQKIFSIQPELRSGLFLRMLDSGKLVTDFSQY